jgi:hypothetical protein
MPLSPAEHMKQCMPMPHLTLIGGNLRSLIGICIVFGHEESTKCGAFGHFVFENNSIYTNKVEGMTSQIHHLKFSEKKGRTKLG